MYFDRIMRVPFEVLKNEFQRVLIDLGFKELKATILANGFAENSRDGVYTHGLNRFPTFVDYVQAGVIVKDAEAELVQSNGIVEQWDGNVGPGIINAQICMDRAIQLAKSNGMGCVALKNNNHWMRGGTYGWQAAEAGCIGICFTNTIANVPPWGGTDPRLGNNPLVIAVPREGGHVVLDMAISQYSYGKLHESKAKGKELPFDGGFDNEGNLTKTPADIIESQRALPIGFWKGSGLSLMLDILATLLSGGQSTAKITKSNKRETGVSQVFICFCQEDRSTAERLVKEILDYTKSSRAEAGSNISYPGENTLKTRLDNITNGIPVDEQIWESVLKM